MELQLYGPLKRYGTTVTLAAEAPLAPKAVREKLVEVLGAEARGIVERSAFGDDERVLGDGDLLSPQGRYAVLPPVAGG